MKNAHSSYPEKKRKPCGCVPAKPCHCEEQPQPDCSCDCDDAAVPHPEHCCDLQCFERPNFYYGHLLTADDLASAQRYVIEKNKLRNRALHGSGVVCGLNLSICPDRGRSICVDVGYALDACGHDIVVCAAQPFDVLACLARPCPPSRCTPPANASAERACYYVAICYREQKKCFESLATPDRQATRIAETYLLELVAQLPVRSTHAERWKKLAERRIRPLSEGAFRQALEKHTDLIRSIVEGQPVANEDDRNGQLFYDLKAAFVEEMKKADGDNPPRYSEAKIRSVGVPLTSVAGYADKLRRALLSLLELFWNAIIRSRLGDFSRSCAEPCGEECVVLGRVIVENEQVVGVSDFPRDFVRPPDNELSFASRDRFVEKMQLGTCEDLRVDRTNYAQIFGLAERGGAGAHRRSEAYAKYLDELREQFLFNPWGEAEKAAAVPVAAAPMAAAPVEAAPVVAEGP